MALAIYLNSSIYPIPVSTGDLSGGLPATLTIRAGDAFVGNTTDPLVVSALAAKLIVLLQADPGNFLAGIQAGTSDAKALSVLLSSLAGGAASIALVSGNGQTAAHSAPLPSPFVVVVRDTNGLPVSGILVTWAVVLGGGSLTALSTTTNGSGQASVTLTLGGSAGTNTVTASASGAKGVLTGSPVTFTATGT